MYTTVSDLRGSVRDIPAKGRLEVSRIPSLANVGALRTFDGALVVAGAVVNKEALIVLELEHSDRSSGGVASPALVCVLTR
jgi:hypothetical protein